MVGQEDGPYGKGLRKWGKCRDGFTPEEVTPDRSDRTNINAERRGIRVRGIGLHEKKKRKKV